MHKYLTGLMIAIALVAASCGSDGGSGSTAAPSDPRAQEIVDLIKSDSDFAVSDEEANCTANTMVAELDDSTIDAMLANPDGEITDVGDPDEALKAVDALLDCVDIEAMMVDSMVADGTPEDAAKCVAEGFGADELREFMRSAVLPEDQVDESAAMELLGTMFALAEECGLS